jgi:death on curing protein
MMLEVISFDRGEMRRCGFGMSDGISYPTMRQVERLYRRVIEMTGGESGYLSRSNLEYLLETVKDVGERFDRKHAIIKKAAFLLYNIVALHPFVNGNKRTAYELVRLFLQANGYDIEASSEDEYHFLLDVASGKDSAASAERWIATNLAEVRGGASRE